MAQRIRDGWTQEGDRFSGIVEVNEIYMGSKEGNKQRSKKLKLGRGAVGKTDVVGAKERGSKQVSAKVVDDTKRKTLHSFVQDSVSEGSSVFTDDFTSYEKLESYEHRTVKRGVGKTWMSKSISTTWSHSSR